MSQVVLYIQNIEKDKLCKNFRVTILEVIAPSCKDTVSFPNQKLAAWLIHDESSFCRKNENHLKNFLAFQRTFEKQFISFTSAPFGIYLLTIQDVLTLPCLNKQIVWNKELVDSLLNRLVVCLSMASLSWHFLCFRKITVLWISAKKSHKIMNLTKFKHKSTCISGTRKKGTTYSCLLFDKTTENEVLNVRTRCIQKFFYHP